MNIQKLTQGLSGTPIRFDTEAEVRELCFDTRKLQAGDAFICIEGAAFDSHTKLAEIAGKQPSLIIADGKRLAELGYDEETLLKLGMPLFLCDDTRLAKSIVFANWYDHPADKLTIIGVTASKGKTTTASMMAAVLEACGRKVGVIGSNGAIYGGIEREVANTTPDSDEMQRHLAAMVECGCEFAVLECSSQGLMQHRTDGIDFAYGILINVQHGDHVGTDEHPTFENYRYCKSLLLTQSRKAVLNLDDPNADAVTEHVTGPILTFGHRDVHEPTERLGSVPTYLIENDHDTEQDGLFGNRFRFTKTVGERKSYDIFVALPGAFNALNAAAVLTVADDLGLPMDRAAEALATIHIPGRLDMIYRSPELSVCIDNAHNRESTKAALTALRVYKPKRLVCVFGAGGNRDIDRRIGMGESSGRYADFTIITTEHNRFEPFSQILKGIKQGIDPTGGPYIVIENRPEAIRHAIVNSEPGDLVAVIGLGHDKYQHILGKNVPQDDEACALKAIEEWKEKRS